MQVRRAGVLWVTKGKCIRVIFNINKCASHPVSPGSPCLPHWAARYKTFMASGLSCRKGRKQEANCGFGDFKACIKETGQEEYIIK